MKFTLTVIAKSADVSLPAWGAWIEIIEDRKSFVVCRSLPAWGAWIEIYKYDINFVLERVAPRVGGVD